MILHAKKSNVEYIYVHIYQSTLINLSKGNFYIYCRVAEIARSCDPGSEKVENFGRKWEKASESESARERKERKRESLSLALFLFLLLSFSFSCSLSLTLFFSRSFSFSFSRCLFLSLFFYRSRSLSLALAFFLLLRSLSLALFLSLSFSCSLSLALFLLLSFSCSLSLALALLLSFSRSLFLFPFSPSSFSYLFLSPLSRNVNIRHFCRENLNIPFRRKWFLVNSGSEKVPQIPLPCYWVTTWESKRC